MKGIKSFFDKLSRYAQKFPTQTFIILGILIVTSLLIYDFYNGMAPKDLIENITASVIEVFFLGLFVVGYNELSKRKKDIDKFRSEIFSYLPWQEKEATYRLVGLIRSLNKLKATKIYLSRGFLKEAHLVFADLKGCTLSYANLEKAILAVANLELANLRRANLKNAILVMASLKGANLKAANLCFANLEGSELEMVDLEGAFVDTENWIAKLKDWKCNGIEDIEKGYYIEKFIKNNKIVYRIRQKAN